jgi:hypothetical protein
MEPRPLSSPALGIARNPPGKAVWVKSGSGGWSGGWGGGGVKEVFKQNIHELVTTYIKNLPLNYETTIIFLRFS